MKKMISVLLVLCVLVACSLPVFAVQPEEHLHAECIACGETAQPQDTGILDLFCPNKGCGGMGKVIDTWYEIQSGYVFYVIQCSKCGDVWFQNFYVSIMSNSADR